MDKTGIDIQVQDTITKKDILLPTPQTNQLGNTLDIGRQKMALGSVRTFTVDSSRLTTPKKVIPVIKTIPFVPETDTIIHPGYNVFSDNFLWPQSPGTFDQLHISPIEPAWALQFKTSKEPGLIAETKMPVNERINISSQPSKSKGFESTDWMLGVIIFSLILVSWLRVGFNRFVQLAVQASYNFFAARRIKEESNVMRSRVFHFMNFLFFVNLALFLSQIIDYQNISILNLKGILLFFVMLGVVISIYSIKGLFLSMLDFFFLTKGAFSYYNSTVFIYNRMVGLVLLPIISVVPFINTQFAPWLLYAGIVALIALYFFRIFRGIQIGIKNRLSIFYLILYLCALEILPLLVLYKLVETYV
jgi:hypothetical protein